MSEAGKSFSARRAGSAYGTGRGIGFALFAVCLTASFASGSGIDRGRIDTSADKMVFNQQTGLIEAYGNVVVRQGEVVLRADRMSVNQSTGDVFAYGTVVLERPQGAWRGDRLQYNFNTGTGDAAAFAGSEGAVRIIRADKAESLEENRYVLHRAVVTTCTNDFPHCHYHVRVREVTVTPDKYLSGRDAVFYFGRVPFFYMPYWYRSLNENFGLSVRPGYNSRMGAYLLTGYKYPIGGLLKGETHLDLRSKRGVGLGQDIGWAFGDEGGGDLALYYIRDGEPVDSDEDAATSDIDGDRYRIRLRHGCSMSDRDYVLARVNYLSDPDILEDFFEKEHVENSQPENYVAYTYRGDGFAGNILASRRLNDFYTAVNRMPECSLSILTTDVPGTWLYYEGGISAAFLERVWSSTVTNAAGHSVFRADSPNYLYYPRKYLGFLNLMPRAGYRATYYSATLGAREETTVSQTIAGTNIVSATNTAYVSFETDAKLRSVFELGMQASFKAYKTWMNAGVPMRHVVEPHADYRFVPEPNLTPEELYQFDSVDAVDEDHSITLGLRNTLQVKRDGRAADLADIDVSFKYGLGGSGGTERPDSIVIDGELRPFEELWFDAYGNFFVEEEGADSWYIRMVMSPAGMWEGDAEYRVTEDESRLFTGSVTHTPSAAWKTGLFGRYEFEGSRFEEYGGYLQRTLDCMAIRTSWSVLPGYVSATGHEQDGEWRVGLEMWLTAFPDIGLSAKHEER